MQALRLLNTAVIVSACLAMVLFTIAITAEFVVGTLGYLYHPLSSTTANINLNVDLEFGSVLVGIAALIGAMSYANRGSGPDSDPEVPPSAQQPPPTDGPGDGGN